MAERGVEQGKVDPASDAVLAAKLQPAERAGMTSDAKTGYAKTIDAARREEMQSHPSGIEEVATEKEVVTAARSGCT